MNNNETKSRENLSNGELFVLEKVKEIILQIHDKLESIGIHVISLPIDYADKISQKIHQNLSPEITQKKNLSRLQKGETVIQEIKLFIKEKIELEIGFIFVGMGAADEQEKLIINDVRKFIDNIKISPLTQNIKPKNLAWNYD